jgi:hypothetical protein
VYPHSSALSCSLQQGASEILKMAICSGVIFPINQPTEWISPAFFVPKAMPGKARLVTDYMWLNRFMDRPVHPFPLPLDVIKSMTPEHNLCQTRCTVGLLPSET